MTAVIGAECRGCGACLLTCPEHAIRPGGPLLVLAGQQRPRVSPSPGPAWQTPPLVALADLCNDCGECVEICPADTIEVIDD